MSKNSKEIHQDIETTQSRIDSRLDQLGEALSLRKQLDGAGEWLKEKFSGSSDRTMGDKALSAKSHVADNPTASILALVSAATAIASKYLWNNEPDYSVGHSGDGTDTDLPIGGARPASSPSYAAGPRKPSATADDSSSWRESAVERGIRARNKASDLKGRARTAASRASEKLSETAESSMETAKRVTEKTKERFEAGKDNHPLAMGLGALATGLLAAVLMPGTRKEDELCGEQADKIKGKAADKADEIKAKATDKVDEFKEKVSEKVDELKQKAKEERLDAEGLADRANEAMVKAKEKTEEKIDEHVAPEDDKALEAKS